MREQRAQILRACWAARCPGKPRCTPCTACSSRGCRAGFRGALRTSTPCRRWPRRSRPWPRAAWRAGRSQSASGTRRRTSSMRRDRRARALSGGRRRGTASAGGAAESPPSGRQLENRQQRLAAQAWSDRPRRARRSAISLTRSKPWIMTSMLDCTTASPSLPNFFTYCLCTTSRNCSCVMPNS